jgi:hypothetical protein
MGMQVSKIEEIIFAVFGGANSTISSPFWLTFKGAIIGLIIGYFATCFGGEGVEK